MSALGQEDIEAMRPALRFAAKQSATGTWQVIDVRQGHVVCDCQDQTEAELYAKAMEFRHVN